MPAPLWWLARSGDARLGLAAMSGENTLKEVIERLNKALSSLEDAVEARIERDRAFADSDAELQRMNADRARLAQERILLFNTASRAKEPFAPAAPPRVTFYSCGPTVYPRRAHVATRHRVSVAPCPSGIRFCTHRQLPRFSDV